MRIADKQLISMKQGIQGSYSTILPNISFGTQAQRQTQGPSDYVIGGELETRPEATSNFYSTGIRYYQNLYDGGKWWNTIKLAKSSYKSSEYERNFSQQSLIANVTEKFYTVLKAQEFLKVYQKSLENSREQLKKTEEMYKIGLVAKKDLYKAQVREGTDRLNVIQQESNLKMALADLKVIMGMSLDENLLVYEPVYQQPEDIDVNTALQKALSSNPDFNSLQSQKQTSLLQYKIAKGDWFPELTSSFSYSRSGSEVSKLYTEFGKWYSYSISFNLSIPLFDGFRRKTNIQQKMLDYKIYDDKIDKKKMEIQNQIENLILALNTYRDMIAINELNIQSAEEDLRLAQEMYRLNSATLLEVLDAQVALTRTQGDLISTKYDAKIAEVRLALVMGTL